MSLVLCCFHSISRRGSGTIIVHGFFNKYDGISLVPWAFNIKISSFLFVDMFCLDNPALWRYSKAIINNIDKENAVTTLKEQIREAARIAEEQCVNEDFNAMSWLDLLLEENPGSFDDLFDKNWDELSGNERQERMVTIRRVL